jgi:cation:H+ antiporter
MLTYILFAIGFVLLIKGADFLVDGAVSVARSLNVSDLAIGLTVVAFGTSTPELFVNLIASFRGNSDIAIGNVLGSNSANVFLILGISAAIYPLAVILDGAGGSVLTRIDGLIFLCFFTIFIYYTFSIAARVEGMEQHVPAKHNGWLRSLLCMIAGLVGLTIGGKWVVEGAIVIATKLGMSEALIGLTIVAVGTSLPELATSAVAAYKKNVEIAVGNVVGSNIFNIFFVLGISASIKPLPFQTKNNIDVGAVIFSSLLLFFFMFTGKKRSLDRWEGIAFLILYFGYVAFLIVNEQ